MILTVYSVDQSGRNMKEKLKLIKNTFQLYILLLFATLNFLTYR